MYKKMTFSMLPLLIVCFVNAMDQRTSQEMKSLMEILNYCKEAEKDISSVPYAFKEYGAYGDYLTDDFNRTCNSAAKRVSEIMQQYK